MIKQMFAFILCTFGVLTDIFLGFFFHTVADNWFHALMWCPVISHPGRLSRSTAHVVWKLYCGSQHYVPAAISAQQLSIPHLTILSKRPVDDSIHIYKTAKNKSTLGSAATNQQLKLKCTKMT